MSFYPLTLDPFFYPPSSSSSSRRRPRGLFYPFPEELLIDDWPLARREEEQQPAVEQKENSNGKKGSNRMLTNGNGNKKEDKQLTTNTNTNTNNKGLSLFSNSWNELVNSDITLSVDEQADKIVISAAVPHFTKEQLKLELKDGLVTISGEMKEEKKGEHSYSSTSRFVSRSMRLPENVKEEEISAKYENGTLNVIFPKLEKGKEKKRDQIRIE